MTRQLNKLDQDDLSQRFIDKYNETQAQHSDWSTAQIVESISHEFTFTRPTFSSSTSGRRISSLPSEAQGRVQATETDDTILESESEESASRRGRQKNIIRADTLLSMFKEAQEKVGPKKDNTDSTESDKDKA